MKKKIFSLILSVIIFSSLNLFVFAEEGENNYDYLLNTGMPENLINELSDLEISSIVETLKSQEEPGTPVTFTGSESQTILMEPDIENSEELETRSISKDELQLSSYGYYTGNNIQRQTVFVKFNWSKINHSIKNDSISYAIDSNDWEILPKSESCEIYYYDPHMHRNIMKKLDRPSEATWDGSTYKIPGPNTGNSGLASFSMRKKCENPTKTVMVHYVDDTSMSCDVTYSVTIKKNFSISVSPKDYIRTTSERLRF